jgi:N-carbamoyl-L-amino-acid hydrolase
VPRADNGRSFESTLLEHGFDPRAIRERRRLLDPARVRAYLELHIEQGPTLVDKGLPAAVVSAIRGCRRFRNARCLGQYGHSGTLPRSHRRDAVAATVALLHHLESLWIDYERRGADLVFTVGELSTDPALHAPSKVSGETRFVLDFRSASEDTMRDIVAGAREAAKRVGDAYRVRFDLGDTSDSPAAIMDPRLRASLLDLLDQPFEMASGAGHDAAVFASVGIPSAMIFVRNDHGSHNPEESMDLEDFAIATRALLRLLVDFPSA